MQIKDAPPHLRRVRRGGPVRHQIRLPVRRVLELLAGHPPHRGDQGHLMPWARVASQSEVIRDIVSGCSPCRRVPHLPEIDPVRRSKLHAFRA